MGDEREIILKPVIKSEDVISSARKLRKTIAGIFEASSGKELDSRMKKLMSDMSETAAKSRDLAKQIEALGRTSIKTKAYSDLEAQLEKASKRYDDIAAKMVRFEETGGDISSRQYQGWVYDLEKVSELTVEISDKMKGMESAGEAFIPGTASEEYQNLISQQESLNNRQRIYIEKWNELGGKLSEETGTSGDTGLSGMAKTLDMLGNAIRKFPSSLLSGIKSGFKSLLPSGWFAAANKTVQVFSKLGSHIKKFGSHIKSAIGHVKKFASHLRSGLSRGLSSANKGFKSGLKNIIRYGLGIGGLFVLFRKLRSVISEGIKDMAQFNGGNNAVNRSMSNLTSSLSYLKSAFVSAFAPILTVVEPILTSLIDKLAEVTTMIGMFIAKLTGASTFQKAIRQQKDFAKSLDGVGGSADKAQQKLAAYDKLEVISQDNAGGGAEGTSWEEVPVEDVEMDINSIFDMVIGKLQQLVGMAEGVGANIGEFLKRGLESIPWDFIQNAINLVAQGIGNLINGFTGVEGLGTTIGTSLAEVLNTVTGFWNNLLNTIKFDQLGAFISDAVMGFFVGVDTDQIANLLSGIINSVSEFLTGLSEKIDGFEIATTITDILNKFLENINWEELQTAEEGIVEDLVGFINGFLETTDWSLVGETLSNSLKLALDFCIDLLSGIDWAEVGEAIVEFISGIDWIGLAAKVATLLLSLISGAIELLWGMLSTVLSNIADLFDYLGFEGIAGFFEGMAENLRNAASWLKEKFQTYIVQPIKDFFGIHSPSTMFSDFGNMLMEGLKKGIADKIASIIAKFTELKTKVTDVFTKLKNSVIEIATKMWDGLKKPINAILSGVEYLVNSVINGLNWMIDALNNLSFDVPDWVPLIGGKTFGFSISNLSNVTLPRLAQGAVIPPNREFAAILGDQKSGTNIETPLDTMVQAFKQALAETGGTHEPVILQLNGRTVAQAVWDEERKRYKQTGMAY